MLRSNWVRLSIRATVVSALASVAVWQWGSAATIYGKALAAQYLIAQSWHQQLSGSDADPEPWPWADTRPVARLQWRSEKEAVDLFVLAGADSASLPFGPGHLHGSAEPGRGTSVFAAHRDTHFRFLQQVVQGDHLYVQTVKGEWLTYAVTQTRVVDSRQEQLQLDGRDSLLLVTCYPFDAVTVGGPLRYVVRAERAAQSLTQQSLRF